MQYLQKELSTITIIFVVLSLLNRPSNGQISSSRKNDRSSINPQLLKVIKEDLQSSFSQDSSLNKAPAPFHEDIQPTKQDNPQEDLSDFNPQGNSVGSSSFSFGAPESKHHILPRPGPYSSFEVEQQQQQHHQHTGFNPAFQNVGNHYQPHSNQETIGHFTVDRPHGVLGTGEFEVSPFFADPEGRLPPAPPFIAVQSLVNTTLPCSTLNSTVLSCDPITRYRTLDGSCNNFEDPTYGRAFTKLQRIFGHVEDPTLMRRLSVSGRLLPSPRVISERVRDVRPRQTQRDHNLLVMALGQFIDHDLIFVPVAHDPDNPSHDLRCPSCSSWVTNPACAPIPIPLADTFFQGENSPRCLSFTRSLGMVAVGSSGNLFLENINENTAFLDLSAVYGSHDCLGRRLRTYSGGKLLTTNTPASPYGLPVLASKSSFAECKTPFEQCYNAGDKRCNEQPSLLVLHTLFLREHNHQAKILHNLNPAWEDEQIFQEARRINIAQYQHIVVSEFLPVLLGKGALLHKFGLLPAGYSATEYQPRVKPQIMQEFSTAAFRVGHTFVPDHLPLCDAGLRPTGSVPLFKVFNDPTIMQDTKQGSYVDAIIRGLVSTRLEGADLKVVDTLRDQLFVNTTHKFSGSDLFSLNIARGRDHGLAPYTAYRSVCHLDPVQSWDQLSPIIPRENVIRLMEAYEHWDDIDLFPGGLAEDVLPDALVGPTFGCIIAMQFHVLKFGDRFWYDNDHGNLTPPQLSSVRQSGVLARLLGRNLDNGKGLVPTDALRLPSKYSNLPVLAEELSAVDHRPWVDRLPRPPRACHYLGRDYGAGALVPASPCLDCRCGEEGSLVCQERPVDCGLLERFVPEARSDEHCYRVCPHHGSPRPPHRSPPHAHFGPAPTYDKPFYPRNADGDGNS